MATVRIRISGSNYIEAYLVVHKKPAVKVRKEDQSDYQGSVFKVKPATTEGKIHPLKKLKDMARCVATMQRHYHNPKTIEQSKAWFALALFIKKLGIAA